MTPTVSVGVFLCPTGVGAIGVEEMTEVERMGGLGLPQQLS